MAKKVRHIVWRQNKLEEAKPIDNGEGDIYGGDQNMGSPIMFMPTMIQGQLQTPFGIVPYSDSNFTFESWIGSTNFDIDESVIDIIDNLDGVEVLQVFSPYTFRIIIGQQFDSDMVKDEIERQVCGVPVEENLEPNQAKPSSKLMRSINRLKARLESQYPHWAILIAPNGTLRSIKAQEITEKFNEDLVLFEDLASNVGATVEKSPSLV